MKAALAAVVLVVTVTTIGPSAMADETCTPNPYGAPGCVPPAVPLPPMPPPPPIDSPPHQDVAAPFSRPHGPIRGSDHRPCVSTREWRSAPSNIGRADLEARWEVTGLGKVRIVAAVGRAILYPRCGFQRNEAQYGAAFRDGRLYGVVATRNPAAVLHGRP